METDGVLDGADAWEEVACVLDQRVYSGSEAAADSGFFTSEGEELVCVRLVPHLSQNWASPFS
ncbi:hypothetical protein EDO6_04600 [Paenibacillus xylanexedens]|nr:hypothetical protein EDO6_04600 [Paenibacillus xylanexedens]